MKTITPPTQSNAPMLGRRLAECIAMMMIGDGALALLEPHRHMKLWDTGPGWWQAIIRPFAQHSLLTRYVGAAELAAGILLAHRQRPLSRG
jgi:hypothetical protein